MKWRIVYLLILFSQSVIIMGAPDPRLFDIRVASLTDLRRTKSVVEFQDSNYLGYNSVEAYWKDESVYVSARNTVLKLNYGNGLTRNDSCYWKPLEEKIKTCLMKGNPKESCQFNHIKIMLLFNGTEKRPSDAIFMCGTMAQDPQCSERSTNDLNTVLQWWNGKHRCPYDPKSSVTALMASDGFLYLGGSVGASKRDYAIFRRDQSRGGRKHQLTTRSGDRRYLLSPNFVSSHEIGDYIYFFFQEVSYEDMSSCRKQIIISRVARVCKDDTGEYVAKKRRQPARWTTFLKARIVCQDKVESTLYSRAEYEYPYDLITSTYIDYTGKTLYATFTSSRYGPAGSVLCRYRLSDLADVFNSGFRSQKSLNLWVTVPNNGHIGCPKKGESWREKMQRSKLSKSHHMVSKYYKPRDGFALLRRSGERWTRVVKTSVRTPRRSYTVLFIATDVGRIHKVVQIKANFCLVEILDVENGAPVNDISLVSVRKTKKSYLIAATNKKVLRIDLHRCNRWTTRTLCLEANDPYCGWDTGRVKCSPVESRPSGRPEYEQKLSGCVLPQPTIDGSWSAWGKWERCNQHGADPVHNRCWCRQRRCDNPPALNGGLECPGASIEVHNCTVDGGWTSWTPWSSCDHTCGRAHRWRSRSCEGPRPKFGGRRCVGARRQEEKCENSPPCPPMKPSPVHGGWSIWSAWSPCTQPCNTGFRNRSRTCTNPTPRDSGNPCFGNSWEYAKCNTMTCKDVEKYSLWTPWIQRPTSRMTRYRLYCTAAVPDVSLLSTNMDIQRRKCRPSDKCNAVLTLKMGTTSKTPVVGEGSLKGTHETQRQRKRLTTPKVPPESIAVTQKVVVGPNQDGGWSPWGPWSECSRTCGRGGRQSRQRKCDRPPPSGSGKQCQEDAEQTRSCGAGPCPIGQWTCWSEWSVCGCDQSKRLRSRTCRTHDGYASLNCPGKFEEAAPCDNSHCYADLWNEWTAWSPCRGGQRLRTRDCRQMDEGRRKYNCKGDSEETSTCFTNKGQSTSGDNGPTFNIYHLIFVGIITFLLGCAVMALMYFCCRKPSWCKTKEHRHRDPIVRPPGAGSGPNAGPSPSGFNPSASVNGPSGAYLEDASLLSSPWAIPRRGPISLDRHHSFHGTAGGNTTLGRQYSNASSSGVYTHASTSVRGARLDPCERWMLPADSDALAYTTFRRPISHGVRPMQDDGHDAWEMLASRVRTRSQGEPASTAHMLVGPPHRLDRRDSEHDSVFTSSRLEPSESRHLLHSPYSVEA